ncbi:MAG: hypothetical protein HYW90_04110 [Candidatus Sungbacteria bacterium]|nr:hypothetical protein [Candidatus Sungbacteria bacterium]
MTVKTIKNTKDGLLVTMSSLTTIQLAEEIEEIIKECLLKTESDANKMILEDELLVGPTEKTSKASLMRVLRIRGISCTENEYLRAALLIREKSLKARGLR